MDLTTAPGRLELLHPSDRGEVVEAVRSAAESGRRLLIVGGRRHIDKGNPTEVDAELWTTQLDAVVSYQPAEMIAVVGGGLRVGELAGVLAEGDQEWPCDAPPDATVGGVVAAAVSSPRRLRLGALRDTVLEVELVTGDGRLVRGGGRTVKNVTGYDLPRLASGSLGTLGVIVQVALKVRPRPKSCRTVRVRTDDPLRVGLRLLESLASPAAILALPDAVEIRLEGWPGEVDDQAAAARSVAGSLEAIDQESFPTSTPWEEREVLVESAVRPSMIPEVVAALNGPWGALPGVGLVWCGLAGDDDSLARLRERVAALGGIAPVLRGPGGLGPTPVAALEIQRRLKAAFDPAGILAPGRGWGGI